METLHAFVIRVAAWQRARAVDRSDANAVTRKQLVGAGKHTRVDTNNVSIFISWCVARAIFGQEIADLPQHLLAAEMVNEQIDAPNMLMSFDKHDGHVDGNVGKVLQYVHTAVAQGGDLVLRLAIVGVLSSHIEGKDGKRYHVLCHVHISDGVLQIVVLSVVQRGILHAPAHGLVWTARNSTHGVQRRPRRGAMAFNTGLYVGNICRANEVHVCRPHLIPRRHNGIRSVVVVFRLDKEITR